MIGYRTVVRFVIAACAGLLRLAVLALALAGFWAPLALAQAQPPAAEPAKTPPQIQLFLDLLEDPQVRSWLEQQRSGRAAAVEQQEAAPMMSPERFATGIDMIRENLSALIAAIPQLPDELQRVWIILLLEFQDDGLIRIAWLIGFFVALGFSAEWLYRFALRAVPEWLDRLPLDTPAARVRAMRPMFSAMVAPGNSDTSCGRYPTYRPNSARGQSATSAPSSRTCPALGRRTPTRSRASELFPAADGPTMASASPGASSKLILRRIGRSEFGKAQERLSTVSRPSGRGKGNPNRGRPSLASTSRTRL